MKRWFHRLRNRGIPFWRLWVLLMAMTVGLAVYTNAQLMPMLKSLATVRVSNTVNRIITESVTQSINDGSLNYDKLVSLEKDDQGRITAVQSNMVVFNQLQSHILDLILAQMEQVSVRELSIPVGSLSGLSLLAGRGPRVVVRMESVGSSSAYFSNEFESAGINQTRHQIILHIDVAVSILLPGFSTATVVSNAFTAAETVIVGQVPDSYTQFENLESGDVKDYMMND